MFTAWAKPVAFNCLQALIGFWDPAHMNKILFIAGLCLALAAAALLFLDIIESGVAALIGFIGIGLIAVSR